MAVGSLAIAENVSVSSTTTLPVPFALNIRSPFDVPVSIELISVRFCPKLIVIVSGSDPAVEIPLAPTNCKSCPDATVIAVESSPATFSENAPEAASTYVFVAASDPEVGSPTCIFAKAVSAIAFPVPSDVVVTALKTSSPSFQYIAALFAAPLFISIPASMSDGVELFLLKIMIGSSIVRDVVSITVLLPSMSRSPLTITVLESRMISLEPPDPEPALIV